MAKRIIILGTGGNCIDILDTLNDINRARGETIYECAGFLDDDPAKQGADFFGCKVLGPLESAAEHGDAFFVNGIGSPSSFWKRELIASRTLLPTDRWETSIHFNRWETIIHPSAAVSSLSQLGCGTVVFQNVTIASRVRIGDHVLILPNSVISHDDVIGDYTCIAGGVCISGGVEIGHSCYIGTGASIIGNVRIGARSLIGMGSVVLHDVPPNTVVVGNPARRLRSTT